MERKLFKRGFTLAETLITLTILGVVATLAIPSIIGHYKKKIIEVRFKQAYSILDNVFDRAAVLSGKGSITNMINDAMDSSGDKSAKAEYFALNYFKPYVSWEKECMHYTSGANCPFGSHSAWLLAMNGDTRPSIGKMYNFYKIRLKNGMDVGFDYLGYCSRILIVIDVNGEKKPNKIGHDVFYFSLFPKGFESYGAKGERILPGYTLGHVCTVVSGNDTATICSAEGYNCAYLIVKNNFKFPDDYPVKF